MGSVSRMIEKQRMIAQRMFDMVDQQQQQAGGIYPSTATRGYPTHRYELVDNNEKFELTVDVPGVKEEDIDIKLEENLLTVQGQRTASSDSSQSWKRTFVGFRFWPPSMHLRQRRARQQQSRAVTMILRRRNTRRRKKPRNQWISTKRKLPIMLPKMEKSKHLQND